jgi:hypothetical protein
MVDVRGSGAGYGPVKRSQWGRGKIENLCVLKMNFRGIIADYCKYQNENPYLIPASIAFFNQGFSPRSSDPFRPT